jgi:hypothetical protein
MIKKNIRGNFTMKKKAILILTVLCLCLSNTVRVQASTTADWAGAYLQIISNDKAEGYKYNLVYIDGDSIPELLIDDQNTNAENLAITIYTYDKKTGKTYQLLKHTPTQYEVHGEHFCYLSKKNMLAYYGTGYPNGMAKEDCMFYYKIKNHKLSSLFATSVYGNYYRKNSNSSWKKISSKKLKSLVKGKRSAYKTLKGKYSYDKMENLLISKGAVIN